MRSIRLRSISRRPPLSNIPAMPHISLSPLSLPFPVERKHWSFTLPRNTSGRAGGTRLAMAARQAVVEIQVVVHHDIQPKAPPRDLPRQDSMTPGHLAVQAILTDRGRHRMRVGGWYQHSAPALFHELGVASDTGRHYWQAARHRFQKGVRHAFSERGQNEQVETAHELRNVVPRSCEPDKAGRVLPSEQFLYLGARHNSIIARTSVT